MKKIALVFTLLVFSSTTFAQEQGSARSTSRVGDAAGYSSRDATVLSMMGWGFILAAGIATLCALVGDGSSSGNNSH